MLIAVIYGVDKYSLPEQYLSYPPRVWSNTNELHLCKEKQNLTPRIRVIRGQIDASDPPGRSQASLSLTLGSEMLLYRHNANISSSQNDWVNCDWLTRRLYSDDRVRR